MRHLLAGIQSSGSHRRWLLTTSRSPPLGKQQAAASEADGKTAAPASEEDRGLTHELPSGEGTLTQAAMYLRNVLVLAAPLLPDRSNLGAGADGAANDATSASGAPPKANSASGAPPKARDLLEGEAGLLEDAALVKLSYVCLSQRDYSGALRYSRRLLEKSCLLPPSEDARKSWAFQVQNMPQAPGTGSAPAATSKCASSVGATTLAVLYASEALLLLGRPAEARALLGSFVSGNAVAKGLELQSSLSQELERATLVSPGSGSTRRSASEAAGADDERARSACCGLSPSTSMGGLTPPGYLLHCSSSGASQAEREKGNNSKDGGHAALVVYPPAELPRLGDAQCMLYTNLAALQVQDGNMEEAERCCERALQAQPRALAPLRTLVYVFLQRGSHTEALSRLKQNRLSGPGR